MYERIPSSCDECVGTLGPGHGDHGPRQKSKVNLSLAKHKRRLRREEAPLWHILARKVKPAPYFLFQPPEKALVHEEGPFTTQCQKCLPPEEGGEPSLQWQMEAG